jgi:MFS family permease
MSSPKVASSPTERAVIGVLTAKSVRTFCYGFLGILLPLYLDQLGLDARGVGLAVTCTLVGSAALTWAVRRPAERLGGRAALIGLAALSTIAAALLLMTSNPWVVVLAAMLGNVAVGTGETGPFLSVEQVVIARAAAGTRRTTLLSVYNLLGYAAAAVGAGVVGLVAPRSLFAVFLAAALLQMAAYSLLPAAPAGKRLTSAGPGPSTSLIRRLAALFALDSFAGGFVLQSLIAYYLHERFGLGLEALGQVFLAAQILTAASLLLAARAEHDGGVPPRVERLSRRHGVRADGRSGGRVASRPSAAVSDGRPDPAGLCHGRRRRPRARGSRDDDDALAYRHAGDQSRGDRLGDGLGGAGRAVRAGRSVEDGLRRAAVRHVQGRRTEEPRVAVFIHREEDGGSGASRKISRLCASTLVSTAETHRLP